MYDEVYDTWKRERENIELQLLSKDFYTRLANYVKRIREESRMLDASTAKAKLIKHELRNAHRLIEELVKLRYEKMFQAAASGKTIANEVLTAEEEKSYAKILPFAESYQDFLKNILLGRLPRSEGEKETHKHVLVRFLKDVPAIIGADMKTYGPFRTEDVGTVPIENAKALVKQGIAAKIELK
jgi:DNA replication factor GINS